MNYIIKLLVPVMTVFNVISFTQDIDRRYTHSSENGYMWIDFEKRMIAKNIKYDFLSSMLENERLKILSGNYKDELGCEKEIEKLKSNNNETDLNVIINMIDEFYLNRENLIIPVRYAYCYCIKQMAGKNKDELELYRAKLLKFSNSELK